jgi:hypothetical protein
MKKLKKYISVIAFQIGVNVIGLPDFVEHFIVRSRWESSTSKYIR